MCSQKGKKNKNKNILSCGKIFLSIKKKIQHCNKQLKYVNLYSVQNIFFSINIMEIQGLMLYFKNSSNQAFNSSDEFLMNMYFFKQRWIYLPTVLSFQPIINSKVKAGKQFLFFPESEFHLSRPYPSFFSTKGVLIWSMYLLGSINQQKKPEISNELNF